MRTFVVEFEAVVLSTSERWGAFNTRALQRPSTTDRWSSLAHSPLPSSSHTFCFQLALSSHLPGCTLRGERPPFPFSPPHAPL